ETGDEIKPALWRRRVVRHHRIVGHRLLEALCAQYAAQPVVAAAKIHDPHLRLERRPEVGHDLRIAARSFGERFGIKRPIAVIVDVRSELLVVPIIESVGEQKAAAGAATVVDGDARERWPRAAGDLAGPVHVDDAIKRGRALTDFAGDRLLRWGPEVQFSGQHDEPPWARSFQALGMDLPPRESCW